MRCIRGSRAQGGGWLVMSSKIPSNSRNPVSIGRTSASWRPMTHKTLANTPDAVEFGPLLEKTVGRFTHIANLIWEKQVGAGASGKYEFRYSYSGTYTVTSALRPGLEAYGRPADHAYQAGPIVAGEWHLPNTTSNLEYRVGVLFGLNADAPRRTWVSQLEYEFY